ncbi:hypothetical protein V6N11_070800 [Hibiscus sabdariffa]|uniref:Uncharacterized protein n=1 Tax=Hibiscus sabdariffa TaxID=183260 RepID=A0ABR2QG33_9ROSI
MEASAAAGWTESPRLPPQHRHIRPKATVCDWEHVAITLLFFDEPTRSSCSPTQPRLVRQTITRPHYTWIAVYSDVACLMSHVSCRMCERQHVSWPQI